ncbi:MAG: DNA-processing protein DprA [Prosthecochloris sp.]|uniref:DNA protecting protein DprA n=1 Tax=Prosthecochloris aestuarii (strain DSM 271 / SK 413) TaxID=290512 RepID=B4S4U1_PROA2|nr:MULTISPECIES: DNA-processing protein DprA [Prosthecochloris]ACF45439.1 DNA protecting protein DprA [Prosthecochloris aestuarii DSM 271]MCW8798630.1 DNA-processing protein DprA [Prosthecochloris sp.]
MLSPGIEKNDLDDLLILLVLSGIEGIGPARIKALLQQAGSPSNVLALPKWKLEETRGIGAALAEKITSFFHSAETCRNAREKAEQMLESLDRSKISIITILDSLYPPLLKEIYDPPPYLFVKGDLSSAHGPGIAIVGTRQASAYGKKVTNLFCRELCSCGITIVSGLAYGIDMAAHTAALEYGGKTIAVLAGGVDNPYTDPTGKVWPKIIENGAMISEEWPGCAVTPEKFPKRNRLISGLSAGTLIVESNARGGSLITASYALDQNREVFAVPGPVFSKTSQGTNNLIEKGHAKLVSSAESVITEILPQHIITKPQKKFELHTQSLSKEEQQILHTLGDKPLHIDLLAEKTAIPASSLLIRLFELEIKNLVEQLPGQIFQAM